MIFKPPEVSENGKSIADIISYLTKDAVIKHIRVCQNFFSIQNLSTEPQKN